MDVEGTTKKERCTCSAKTRDIRCPFFRRHSSTEIRCEAMMDRCSSALIFERKADKEWYQSVYCESRYECCEHYRMLMAEKYAE